MKYSGTISTRDEQQFAPFEFTGGGLGEEINDEFKLT
jgi:hypothetical protein